MTVKTQKTVQKKKIFFGGGLTPLAPDTRRLWSTARQYGRLF